MKILVTPRSVTRHGHPSLDRLRTAGYEVIFCRPAAQPTEDELCALLPGCAGYLAGVEHISARVLAAAPDLRAISRNGTGVDHIDLAAAEARKIPILRAEGANARGVAELTFALLLALARNLAPADAALKRGVWDRGHAGLELEGKTLGLVGCGKVGQIVTRIAHGFGMRVLAYDPFPSPSFLPGHDFRYASFEEVCAQADFLSLHCPPLPGGHPLIDAAALTRMKAGAYLINTARYDLCHPEALLTALDSKHLAGLALDVFDAEPPHDTRFPEHARILGTPHIGGYTRESIDRAMTLAVENLLAALGA